MDKSDELNGETVQLLVNKYVEEIENLSKWNIDLKQKFLKIIEQYEE